MNAKLIAEEPELDPIDAALALHVAMPARRSVRR